MKWDVQNQTQPWLGCVETDEENAQPSAGAVLCAGTSLCGGDLSLGRRPQFTERNLTVTDGHGGTSTYAPGSTPLTVNIVLVGSNTIILTDDTAKALNAWDNIVVYGTSMLAIVDGVSVTGNLTVNAGSLISDGFTKQIFQVTEITA